MTALLLGDSHCIAITKAKGLGGDPSVFDGGMIQGAWHFYKPFFEPSAHGFTFIDDGLQASLVSRLDRSLDKRLEGRVVLSLGLSSEAMLGSLARESFDFQPGYRDTERHFLSIQAVEKLIDTSQSHILDFYKFLHSRGYLRGAVAGPAIQARHRIAEFYGARAPAIRARFEAPVRNYLAEIGCPIVELPQTWDSDGFLRKEYWGEDWSHANEDFGKLVMDQLKALDA